MLLDNGGQRAENFLNCLMEFDFARVLFLAEVDTSLYIIGHFKHLLQKCS
jgi:hypothetical protein